MTVTGDFGAKPTVTFDPSYAAAEDTVKVVFRGNGPAVETDQLVTFDYVAISGVDGLGARHQLRQRPPVVHRRPGRTSSPS